MPSLVLSALYAVTPLVLIVTVAVIIPILQMRRRKFGEVKSLALDYSPSWQVSELEFELGLSNSRVCTFNRRLTK